MTHTLTSNTLTATIAAHGAELQSLKNHQGDEFIWQADPMIWARHAPLLFPIVGRLANDQLIHQGNAYPITQHGFARDMEFSWLERGEHYCLLQLVDSQTSRERYPFPFQLQLAYQLQDNCLAIDYILTNNGDTDLPASIGAHPAFAWPLPGCHSKANHTIAFEKTETAPIRRLDHGLMLADGQTTPVQENALLLKDELFIEDAIIFDQLRSHLVSYSAPGSAKVVVEFSDFPHLGIWSKPGAEFVCIEPWQGYASPTNFNGEFTQKPGIALIKPGQSKSWKHAITIEPA